MIFQQFRLSCYGLRQRTVHYCPAGIHSLLARGTGPQLHIQPNMEDSARRARVFLLVAAGLMAGVLVIGLMGSAVPVAANPDIGIEVNYGHDWVYVNTSPTPFTDVTITVSDGSRTQEHNPPEITGSKKQA